MIVYFTGTGNSRYAAQCLSQQLQDELVDAGALLRRSEPLHLTSEKPWVFVSPTYAWQIPRIFAQLLRDSRLEGSRDAWFVMTCGDGIGDAGTKLQSLCREKGWRCHGTAAVRMPENYIAMFPVPDAAEAAEIRRRAEQPLLDAAAAILAGRSFPEEKPGVLGKIYTNAVNPLFYRFCVHAGPFWASDDCISCGKCVKACPLRNVALASGKPRWGQRCTHCMACISVCPVKAIEYGKKSRGKPRYRCPEYEKKHRAAPQ